MGGNRTRTGHGGGDLRYEAMGGRYGGAGAWSDARRARSTNGRDPAGTAGSTAPTGGAMTTCEAQQVQ